MRFIRVLLQQVLILVVLTTGWQGQLWAQGPVNVSVSPNAGTGMNQTFTAVYSDSGGYSQMQVAMLLIHPQGSTSYGFYDCFVYYNKWSNGLNLMADAGGPWLGPITAGSSSTLSNSQCTLNGAGSSVTGSGNTLTINYSITFNSSYNGTKNVFLWVEDLAGNNTGYQQLGTWTVGTPCTPHNFVSGSATPTTITPGGTYQLACDYGVQYGYIYGNNCNSFTGWQGTAALFSCTAPATPGTYAQSCSLGDGPTQYFCARPNDPAGNLTVSNPVVSVTVSPSAPVVPPGQTQQFSATVTGTTNTSVVWSMNPTTVGTLSSGGLYTAPSNLTSTQTVTVTATSVADSTKSASTTLTVQACTPGTFVSGSTSPLTIVEGGTYQVSCNYGTTNTAYIFANYCGQFVGWQGNNAVFNCTAPSTPGTYAQGCDLGTAPPQYFCARTNDSAGTLTVTPPAPDFTISLSDAASGLNPLFLSQGGGSFVSVGGRARVGLFGYGRAFRKRHTGWVD